MTVFSVEIVVSYVNWQKKLNKFMSDCAEYSRKDSNKNSENTSPCNYVSLMIYSYYQYQRLRET